MPYIYIITAPELKTVKVGYVTNEEGLYERYQTYYGYHTKILNLFICNSIQDEIQLHYDLQFLRPRGETELYYKTNLPSIINYLRTHYTEKEVTHNKPHVSEDMNYFFHHFDHVEDVIVYQKECYVKEYNSYGWKVIPDIRTWLQEYIPDEHIPLMIKSLLSYTKRLEKTRNKLYFPKVGEAIVVKDGISYILCKNSIIEQPNIVLTRDVIEYPTSIMITKQEFQDLMNLWIPLLQHQEQLKNYIKDVLLGNQITIKLKRDPWNTNIFTPFHLVFGLLKWFGIKEEVCRWEEDIEGIEHSIEQLMLRVGLEYHTTFHNPKELFFPLIRWIYL